MFTKDEFLGFNQWLQESMRACRSCTGANICGEHVEIESDECLAFLDKTKSINKVKRKHKL